MNPMLAALQKNRAYGPASDVPASPESPAAAGGPGDALLEKLAAIEAKIDKLCSAMNLNGPAGDEPAEKDAKEAAPNDDGY